MCDAWRHFRIVSMMEYYEFDAWLSWVNFMVNRSYGATRCFPQHLWFDEQGEMTQN
jgi:hypothetical protein